MAYFVPIIANRKNCRKSSPGEVLAGLIIFLVFGIMFFLFFVNRSGVFGFKFSIILWIGGFMIFFAIILAISAAISATSIDKSPVKSRSENIYTRQVTFQKTITQTNPYKIPLGGILTENTSEKAPINEIINYCRYCGAEKDLKAIFCHMCGSKFE
ncbi:MAG: hypothetical protein ACFE8B_12560 [Candidatus Hermodarchaeota archaeon]